MQDKILAGVEVEEEVFDRNLYTRVEKNNNLPCFYYAIEKKLDN